MHFSRSTLGQSNQALFYDVDFVVYVESVSLRNAVPSHDEVFWGHLISICRPLLKIRVKALGSKTELQPIAAEVSLGNVSNVIVCMDRDFDGFYGLMRAHPRIMYTFGYSWENDIIRIGKCVEILDATCSGLVLGTLIEAELISRNRALYWLGSRVGRFDVALQLQGKPLQNKRKSGELLKENDLSSFCYKKIIKRLRQIVVSGCKLNYLSIINFDYSREYHGKTVLFILYHLMKYLSKKHGSISTFDKNYFTSALLKDFINRVDTDTSDICAFYRSQCTSIR